MTKAKRTRSLPQEEAEKPLEDWAKGVPPVSPESAVKVSPETPPQRETPQQDKPNRTFQFREESGSDEQEPVPKPKLGRNPLLSQI